MPEYIDMKVAFRINLDRGQNEVIEVKNSNHDLERLSTWETYISWVLLLLLMKTNMCGIIYHSVIFDDSICRDVQNARIGYYGDRRHAADEKNQTSLCDGYLVYIVLVYGRTPGSTPFEFGE